MYFFPLAFDFFGALTPSSARRRVTPLSTVYSPMFNYRAVHRRTRNQSPLSFYLPLAISILSRLSLCLTFITIASDTSW